MGLPSIRHGWPLLAIAHLLPATLFNPILFAAAISLDEAILNDILHEYEIHPATTCDASTASNTTFTFEYPGVNNASEWDPTAAGFEESLFQAMMSHTDADISQSWEIRVGSGGNMYSHFTETYGETISPQAYASGRGWVDEVSQLVSVSENLNGNEDYPQFCDPDAPADECAPYYIHQAGAYQEDSPYTDAAPFFSPSLAKHCSENHCMFASWGTQAHLPTPFTSPVIYITKFTNCGNGIIEHTQVIHNFAPVDSDPLLVDQTYFNVGWAGVRPSNLPYALEPQNGDDPLAYENVNATDYLPLCLWGQDDLITNIRDTAGYTTFVGDGLIVNREDTVLAPWCRKAGSDCTTDGTNCMTENCDANDTPIPLGVRGAVSDPNCRYDPNNNPYGGYVALACNMRLENGFGQTKPYASSADPCAPWKGQRIGFKNTITEQVLEVSYVRHWSWDSGNYKVYFSVFVEDTGEASQQSAVDTVNDMFVTNGADIPIEVVTVGDPGVVSAPQGYDPGALPTFTFVYGKGEDYETSGGSVQGYGRRRLGSTLDTRDFTVFTINWMGGARLEPGNTYHNRAFMFSGKLESVHDTASDLNEKIYVDKIGPEDWNPRTIDIYQGGTGFGAVAAATAQGSTTSCDNGIIVPTCSGYSTPQAGHIPFFYVTSGSTASYFGPDPYHFSPSFDGAFPYHRNAYGFWLRVQTGPGGQHQGRLEVFVDSGDGYVSEAKGWWNKDVVVLHKYYSNIVGVKVRSWENRNGNAGWAGSIEVSRDNEGSYIPLWCEDCEDGTGLTKTTSSIVVDLDSSETHLADTQCLGDRNCTIAVLPPECLLIKTGPRAWDQGRLEVFVDSGDGYVSEAKGWWNKDVVALDKCYSNIVGVKVRSWENANGNAGWAGSIEVSRDNEESYIPLWCEDCTGPTKTTSSIVVDFDGSETHLADTQCIGGNNCTIVHPHPSDFVRSYALKDEGVTVRPSWKLMGFFDPNECNDSGFETAMYDENLCN